MQQIQEMLNDIFQNIFEDDTLEVHDSLTAADVDGWDSVTHVRLLLAIERSFGIKFTAGEIGRLRSVGDLMKLIQTKTAAQ
jgi:acyl carrier protein